MIIIYPTETCYGIGCSVFEEDSIRKIIELKGRSSEKGMLVVVPDIKKWKDIANPNKTAIKLAEEFWPGPLTIVSQAKYEIPDILCSHMRDGTKTIACRQSSHEIASALAIEHGPIVSTSANISGGDNPYSIDQVPQKLKNHADIVIDGGKLRKTKPSTIFDSISMKIIRRGPILEKEIRKTLGEL